MAKMAPLLLVKCSEAKKGKNPNFKKYAGTEVSDSEGNVLIASVKGHPVLQKQGVKIDETLTVAQANLKTGNINFDGSVVINGDVLPRFRSWQRVTYLSKARSKMPRWKPCLRDSSETDTGPCSGDVEMICS